MFNFAAKQKQVKHPSYLEVSPLFIGQTSQIADFRDDRKSKRDLLLLTRNTLVVVTDEQWLFFVLNIDVVLLLIVLNIRYFASLC